MNHQKLKKRFSPIRPLLGNRWIAEQKSILCWMFDTEVNNHFERVRQFRGRFCGTLANSLSDSGSAASLVFGRRRGLGILTSSHSGELWKAGYRIKFPGQPFRVLTALLARPDDIVTREELQHEIWGENTNVDFDQAIAAAINKVREALGDSAENHIISKLLQSVDVASSP